MTSKHAMVHVSLSLSLTPTPTPLLQVQDVHGNSALLLAASQGHLQVVERLLQEPGCDPQRSNPLDGSTALLLAARGGHAEVRLHVRK